MRIARAGAVALLALVAGAGGACSVEGKIFDLPSEGRCAPGSLVACYTGPAGTEGVGICRGGAQLCNADGVPDGACIGELTPEGETCDADERDEDCDGAVNEEGLGCVCGDGYVSEGEACDDGHDDPTGPCTAACELACGDGIVETMRGEGCDDGGTSDGDPCSPTCQEQTVLEVVAGSNHTCALLNDGSVKCWGGNDVGQLGLGNTLPHGDGPGEMGDYLPPVELGTDTTGKALAAKALAAGDDHTCALLSNGSVKCWGANGSGRLGLGDIGNRGDNANEMGDSLLPIDLGAGNTAVAITAGAYHTCALLNDDNNGDSVKCWGDNQHGQLGLGDMSPRGDEPGEMDGLPAVDLGAGKVVAIEAGRPHTCALRSDGSVKCWGRNHYGQLGLGDTENRGDEAGEMGDSLRTVDLGFNKTAVALAGGMHHTCALLKDGSLKCWGRNDAGRLGLGNTAHRGDNPGEMGDALPTVKLFSDLW